ncbi:MAG: SGNH/GDSL hydrolase family protein [Planctomycetes bacterium]|nr:SGNH/GDSL hydrolase family protein [Planctomycetota bacterium]
MTSFPWRKVLLATIVFLVVLEAVLQVGALWATGRTVSRSSSSGAGCGGAARQSILCIGDSYTYGAGATTPSATYPARLEAILRGRGFDVAVTNSGFPGQHSRHMLGKLAGRITDSTRVLCVLAGANDSWRRPEFVDHDDPGHASPSGGTDGFEFCWRTGRLLSLLFNFEANSWSQRGNDEAEVAATPTPGATATAVADPEAGFDLLTVAGLLPDVPRRPVITAGAEAAVAIKAVPVLEAQAAGDAQRAFDLGSDLLEEYPRAPLVISTFAKLAAQAGRPAAVERAVRMLLELRRSEPSAAVTEGLARAMWIAQRHEEALELALERTNEEPAALEAWEILTSVAYCLGRLEIAEKAMLETISLSGRTRTEQVARIARNLARLKKSSDPSMCATLIVAAVLLDGRVAETRLVLDNVKSHVSRQLIESVLGRTGKAGDRIPAAIQAILDEVYDGANSEAWSDAFRRHLTAIADLARSHDIRVVFLTYPFRQEAIERTQLEVAAALDAPIVDIRRRFDRELMTRNRDELFVPDGHCNDAGYDIMAQMVADVVAPMLSR